MVKCKETTFHGQLATDKKISLYSRINKIVHKDDLKQPSFNHNHLIVENPQSFIEPKALNTSTFLNNFSSQSILLNQPTRDVK